MKEWIWNGARWWKCDFHTHTPASKDYGKGQNQKALQERSPKQWLLDYMRAGVDCIAVTDHNTGAWIDVLRNAMEELIEDGHSDYRKLYIFSGMEISISGGIHLLAIFDPSKTSSDLDALRGAVEYGGTPGQNDDVTRKAFVDVVSTVTSARGIAIPAHVDEEGGLFNGQQGTTLDQALNCKDIFAMELVDPAFQKPQLYIDKGLRWTEILGSDAHHPSGNAEQQYPGSHFTWVKMGAPSIKGLRLALLDGDLSVRRSDQDMDNPNEHASLTLDSIEVSQARYMGRSQVFTIEFNPWFNAIIGGRGTGKSTVVEFLRTALRRKDELPETLQPEFEQYNLVYRDREDSGLLTEDASIRVICRKDGDRFRVQWNPAGDLEPIEQEVNGQWRRAEGDIQQRFPVRIYSQKQVFQLARTPLALLKIIDEAPEVGYHSWSEKWKVQESHFLSLRAKAREIKVGTSEEPRLRGELDDVKRKLAIFEQSGHTEILKSFQERSRQYREVEVWEESWTGTGEQLREVAAEIVPDLLAGSSFNSDSAPDRELQECAAKTHDHLDEIRKSVETLASQANEVVSEWRKSKDESSWKQSVDAATQAYQELTENLSREGAGDPAAYGELVQRRQVIEQRIEDLDERKKQVDDLNNQADAHLQHLLEIRRELTASRRKFLNAVLSDNPYVQIQVAPYGAGETVESEFRRLLQREDGTFEKDIGSPNDGGLLGGLYEQDGGAEVIEENLLNIKTRVTEIASGEYGTGTVADRRFATHVGNLPPEAIDRLDLWFPEDSLEVQYSARGDGQRFRSIQEGSPGQKTAALLAFLLSYGDEPLILDQPEDDLDNHLIYDLIVTQLRAIKRHRQVIVVTHNANIVVNGDAELVVALAARGGETQKECEGSLQEQQVRETICEVMEGGRKAFEDRYRRIALEGRHV
ncbi:MAG: ABC transporter [Gemmatimonadetes bacterium]|nr:ABC transporter [Gemmatimonadota bacterium]MYB70686.1 ABC transporter [Gemmatimonadota bacterium]